MHIFHSHFSLLPGGLTSKGSFPDSRSVRYPTPGTLNPEVTLWLLDLTNLTAVQKYWIKEPISMEGQWVDFNLKNTLQWKSSISWKFPCKLSFDPFDSIAKLNALLNLKALCCSPSMFPQLEHQTQADFHRNNVINSTLPTPSVLLADNFCNVFSWESLYPLRNSKKPLILNFISNFWNIVG
jgi:hypothetical protein